MLQLKLSHTMHVVKDAVNIMRGENWDREHTPTGRVCALLHDVGRFSQFTEFGTFRDSESIDHAERGIAIIRELDLLRGASASTSARIVDAIRWHNKKAVPQELDTETASLAHLLRDADKLDIFRVMETAVEDGSIESNPEITWGLDIRGAPNPKLVEVVLAEQPVDYTLIHAISDFILIQIGWVISGLHYATTRSLARERNVVEFRRRYLKTLTNDPAVDICCDAAEKVLSKC